jgi:hypothetical protein
MNGSSSLRRSRPGKPCWEPDSPLPRRLRQLANEACGRPGPASPSGRAGDRCCAAGASLVLAGRAPGVPQASVGSGHCPCPPTCRISLSGAVRGCFPSSRSFNTGSVCWGWRPVQPVSCSKARSIRLVASRTSCRSSSVNSAARYSTIQAILGRSWIIYGVSRSPGARSECVSCVSWVSRLPQVGHLGAGVVMHGSMVRAEVPVRRVRIASGTAGRRRAQAVTTGTRNRRSQCLPRS